MTLNDIVGVKIFGSRLELYLYCQVHFVDELQQSGCCCCTKVVDPAERKLETIELQISDKELANEWHIRLTNAANGGDIQNKTQLIPKRKILALLNPFSGQGLAVGRYNEAKEMFDKGHLDVTLVETQRRMHAFDILKNEV